MTILMMGVASALDGPTPWFAIYKNTNSIPTYTNVIDLSAAPYNMVGDNSTDWSSTLSTAISAAPNYSTLDFPSGPVILRSQVLLGNGVNKILHFRGRGMTNTWLKTEIPSGSSFYLRPSSVGGYGASLMVTGGTLAKGSFSATFDSVAGVSVGSLVKLAQTNDTSIGWGWLVGGGRDPGVDVQGFHTRITNIVSNTLYWDIPTPEDYNNKPYVKTLVHWGGCGWSDMTITMTNRDTSAGLIQWIRTTNCWVNNVRMSNFWNRGVMSDQGFNNIVSANIIGGAENPQSSVYCIQSSGCDTGLRVENNIVYNASAGILVQGGSIYGAALYNFSPQQWPWTSYQTVGNAMAGMINFHGGNAQFWIAEGNQGPAIYSETTTDIGGSTSLYSGLNRCITIYRNHVTTTEKTFQSMPPDTTQGLKGIEIEYTNRQHWVALNIIGRPETTSYPGWTLGIPSGCEQGCNFTDSIATNSTNLRYVNNFHYFINSLVTYNGDTYLSAPDSLYFSSRPAWYPPGVPFPPFDPSATVKTNWIPATYRWFGIAYPTIPSPPPAGGGTNFIRQIFYWFFGPQ